MAKTVMRTRRRAVGEEVVAARCGSTSFPLPRGDDVDARIGRGYAFRANDFLKSPDAPGVTKMGCRVRGSLATGVRELQLVFQDSEARSVVR